jgi:hypothetical protein
MINSLHTRSVYKSVTEVRNGLCDVTNLGSGVTCIELNPAGVREDRILNITGVETNGSYVPSSTGRRRGGGEVFSNFNMYIKSIRHHTTLCPNVNQSLST